MEKYVIIERDGIVNVQKDTPIKTEKDFILMPFVIESLINFKKHGIKPIIVTQQEALAKGEMSQEDIEAIHKKMENFFLEEEVRLHDIFVCPSAGMDWDAFKYPSPKTLQVVLYKHKLEPTTTFYITNRIEGLQAAWELNLRTIFVRTGKVFRAKRELVKSSRKPDYNERDILAASLQVIDFYKQHEEG